MSLESSGVGDYTVRRVNSVSMDNDQMTRIETARQYYHEQISVCRV